MTDALNPELQTSPSVLSLSDEDFAAANFDEPASVAPDVTDEETDAGDDGVTADPANTGDDPADDVDEDESPAGTESDEDEGDPAADDDADAAEGEGTGDDAEAGDADETVKPDESTEVDYKAEHQRLLAPFRANGKEMQVGSVDEAIQLMQMGANFSKKMAALKPSLKTLKLLDNNELNDPEKLSFLIDLHKKDPGAIRKLVKDSGLDPLDMDGEGDSDYKPKTYTVDDRELALDTVIEEIQDTPSYTQTINIVSTKWDGPSKQTVANSPQLLKVINDHVASGIYDRVSREVEKERMFGRLSGLSDLDAYRQVGDALNAKGGFDDLAPSQAQAPAARTVVTPKPKAADPEIKSKKRAASSTKTKPAAVSDAPGTSALAVSDEDFLKQFDA